MAWKSNRELKAEIVTDLKREYNCIWLVLIPVHREEDLSSSVFTTAIPEMNFPHNREKRHW